MGGEVVWGKVSGFPWWPAQRFYRSGIELIRKKVSSSKLALFPALNPKTANTAEHRLGPVKSIKTATQQTESSSSTSTTLSKAKLIESPLSDEPDVYLCFFLDDTHYVLRPSEARTSVVPYLKRVKEIRSGMGKRLSTAHTLATLESELQRSAVCAFRFLSMEHLERYGGQGEERTPILTHCSLTYYFQKLHLHLQFELDY